MNFYPIVPFEPISTEEYPTGKQWISQVKWDGVRMLAYYDGLDGKLFNRKLHDRTMQYPELTNIQKYCVAKSIILDGEVIALKDGKPSFHQIMKRDSVRKSSSLHMAKLQIPITYMIFDLLYFNGDWVTDRPLTERQHILQHIVRENETIQLVKNHDNADGLFQAVIHHQLEGIVMKDLNSTYVIQGKDKRWQKKKVLQDLHAVVGGVTHRGGFVNSLLLGLYDEREQLWYIGHAGTGKLTQNDWAELTEIVPSYTIRDRPFINQPNRSKDTTWLQPRLGVKINFLEWTENKTLRQPSIQAFVPVDIKQCSFKQS